MLFLTLRTFSATGGIEKVSRAVAKVLSEEKFSSNILSLHDSTSAKDDRYVGKNKFIGFGGQRFKFISTAFKCGLKSDVILLSHVNLLPVARLIQFFSPSTQIWLIAHGIEVWPPLLKGMKKKWLRHCHKIIAVSRFTGSKLLIENNLDAEKIVVIPNALDPFILPKEKGFNKSEWRVRFGLQPDDVVLLTLTRLSFSEIKKGYDRVMEALGQLAANNPKLKYVLAGKYDAAEKNRIENLIQKYNLQGKVILTGFVPEEELPSLYQMANMYIMPSEKEGFGITFIEAAFYGLLVIAGNKDGSAEALMDGRLGQLINPESVEEIQLAIQNILNDPNSYQPNSAMVTNNFSFPVYQQKWKQLLHG